VNKTNEMLDSDKVIIGDEFGNVILIKLNMSDFSTNNTKVDLVDNQKKVVNLERFKQPIIKKKLHDAAVNKVKFKVCFFKLLLEVSILI
jgi:hypothetical protein